MAPFPACAKAFILTILCGNAVLKSAFVTFLNGLILQLDQEIALLQIQITRLNVLNSFLQLEIQAVQSLTNKIASDLNLFIEPFQQFSSCTAVEDLNKTIQESVPVKKLAGLQNKIYQWERTTNLTNRLQNIIQKKEQLKTTASEWIDWIADLCS